MKDEHKPFYHAKVGDINGGKKYLATKAMTPYDKLLVDKVDEVSCAIDFRSAFFFNKKVKKMQRNSVC